MNVNRELNDNGNNRNNKYQGNNNRPQGGNQGNNNRPQGNGQNRLDLTKNNMGIEPRFVVYDLDSAVMQNTITRFIFDRINDQDTQYLEQNNDISIRCIQQSPNSKDAHEGALPWQFVIFRRVQSGKNYSVKYNVSNELARQMSRYSRNVKDDAQIQLTNDPVINNAIAPLSADPSAPVWRFVKDNGNRYAISILDSTKTTAFLLGIQSDDIKRIGIDVLKPPKTRRAYNRQSNAMEVSFATRISIGKMNNRPKVQADLARLIR